MNFDTYKEKVQWLNDRNDEYNRNHPTVSDKEWDDVYFEVQSYEFANPDKIVPYSPTQTIYFKEEVSDLKKVKHNHPMLSLDKTKDIDRLSSFIGDKEYIVMGKMDGLTCSLHYENGQLVSAETRGNDGMIGEDVTHNALVIPSIPKRINFEQPITIDGEVICKNDDFEYFKSKFEYKHSRNFASGSFRLHDAKECAERCLYFVAWDIIEDYPGLDQLNKKLKFLHDLNIDVTPYIFNEDKAQLEKQIEIIKTTCQELQFPIDGVVIKYDNVSDYRAAGCVGHHFKGGLAYKFYDEKYETTLRDIEWSMGRTGVLTPVAIFDSIEIDGTDCSRASLHNLSVMNETLGTHPYAGQSIKVYKANEIIPQIDSADKDEEHINWDNLIKMTKCPICGGELEVKDNDGVITVWCANPQCEGKLVNVLDHFCGKKGLDIKGLSVKTLEKLIDWEWVNDIIDIPKLKDHRNEWINKAGFGAASVDKILKAIDDRLAEAPLSAFISGLGIPLVGTRVAKQICEYVKTWAEFKELVEDIDFTFEKWNGFGYEMNKALKEFDYSKADAIVDFITFKPEEHLDKTVQLEAQNFVITGKLQNFKNRQELVDLIEAAGGKVQSSISAKTNYLINNDINSTSTKNKKAKELNIPIITETEVMEMLK